MIFPITEKGQTTFYKTDAPIKHLHDAFYETDQVEEMKEHLHNKGYDFEEYENGFALNFDNK